MNLKAANTDIIEKLLKCFENGCSQNVMSDTFKENLFG